MTGRLSLHPKAVAVFADGRRVEVDTAIRRIVELLSAVQYDGWTSAASCQGEPIHDDGNTPGELPEVFRDSIGYVSFDKPGRKTWLSAAQFAFDVLQFIRRAPMCWTEVHSTPAGYFVFIKFFPTCIPELEACLSEELGCTEEPHHDLP